MGWILFLEMYFSPVLFSLVVGLFYPIVGQVYRLAVKEESPALPVKSLMLESVKCSFKLSTFVLIALLILAFISSILFSIWAIAVQLIA